MSLSIRLKDSFRLKRLFPNHAIVLDFYELVGKDADEGLLDGLVGVHDHDLYLSIGLDAARQRELNTLNLHDSGCISAEIFENSTGTVRAGIFGSRVFCVSGVL